MRVIVNRTKCRKISVQYRGGVAIITAPHRASVHQIRELLAGGRFYRQPVLSQQACTLTEPKYSPIKQPLHSTSDTVNIHNSSDNRGRTVLEQKLSDTLMSAQSVMLGGNVYSVASCNSSKATFSGEYLNINSSKYYDGQQRRRAVKAFIKQYADTNLRASISKVGCALSYCPTNIKLITLDSDMWYDQTRMLANNAIYMDYRVVQLPYTCQDRLINNCYNILQNQPVAVADYISDICQEYLFIKNL